MKAHKLLGWTLMLFTIIGVPLWAGGNQGSTAGNGGVTTIRFSWWGGAPRNEKTMQLLDLFEQKNPGYKVTREYSTWADHWIKFNTQAAAGIDPDVSQHVMMSVQEYVDKGVLQPLDDLVKAGKINVSDWSPVALGPGYVNNKLYCIVYGLTAAGIIYNPKIIQNAGLSTPSDDWTWTQFAQFCKDLQQKLPNGVFAVENGGFHEHGVETYMRSLGKRMYTADNTALGFDKQDLINYWTIWEDIRKAGACSSAELASELQGVTYELELFTQGRAAMKLQNINHVTTYQPLMQPILQGAELQILRIPRTRPGQGGDYMQPTMFGISAKSKIVDASARLIDFMVNDVDGALIYKADLGVPGDPDVLKALDPTLNPVEKHIFRYVQRLFADNTLPPTYVRAGGSATVFDPLLRRAYEDLATGTISMSAAADRFFQEANAVLIQNKR